MRGFLLIAALAMALSARAEEKKKVIYSDDPKIDAVAQMFWRVADRPDPITNIVAPHRFDVVSGVHRTPFGLQVDPYCFKVVGLKKKEDIERWEKNFDQTVSDTVSKVMNECWSNYSELGSYITEWARKLSRTALTCSSLGQKQMNAGAYHVGTISGIKVPDQLLPDEHKRMLGFYDTPDDTAASDKPVIVFPSEKALAAGNIFPMFRIDDDLIHEIFHATAANNLKDHDVVESAPRNDGCGVNASVDRICVISSLCSGADLPKHDLGETAQNVLYKRMQKCSREQACDLTFKNEFTSPDGSQKGKPEKLSQGLLPEDAAAVCDKIFNEGCCREFVASENGHKQVLSRPEVMKVARKVMKRINAILPKKKNEIPAAALKAFPDIYDNFKSLQNTECFKAVFDGDVDSGLSIKGISDKTLSEKERYGIGFYWDSTLDIASMKPKRGANCHDNAHVEWLQLGLRHLSERIGAAMSSSMFTQQIRERKFQGYENIAKNWDSPKSKEHDYMVQLLDGQSPLVSALYGDSLYWDYWSVIQRYHPDGDSFNCATLSVSEYGMLGCYGKLKKEPPLFCELETP